MPSAGFDIIAGAEKVLALEGPGWLRTGAPMIGPLGGPATMALAAGKSGFGRGGAEIEAGGGTALKEWLAG